MSPSDPARRDVERARIIERIRTYVGSRTSFALETTLASGRTLEIMRSAKSNGFRVDLIYICLDTTERNILRVKERVLQGGHDVPPDDVRRRYLRSLKNLPAALRIADGAVLYDNSGTRRRRMLEVRGGLVVWTAPEPTTWVGAVVRDLTLGS